MTSPIRFLIAQGNVALRPVRSNDVTIIHQWMNDPDVAMWWDLAKSEQDVASYLQDQIESEHSDAFVVELDDEPVGYVEIYDVKRDRLAKYWVASTNDVGVHILIGEAKQRGRGIGAALLEGLSAWLLVSPTPSTNKIAERVIAEPDATNMASVRAFQRAGFAQSEFVELPEKRAALMIRTSAKK
jgi:acetyl CoA:N6-hydroxylysine acetyl transferase